MEPFIGTICAFAFNYAPLDWAACNGELLNFQQYQALGTLLGNTYGGNGTTSFGVPDLRQSSAIGQGIVTDANGEQKEYYMGDYGGSNSVTISPMNLPPHSHHVTLQFKASTAVANSNAPIGNYQAASPTSGGAHPVANSLYSATANVAMAAPSITLGTAGSASAVPVAVCNPYLALNYSIALYGIYPMRQ